MAKRHPLSLDTAGLERNLEQSKGQGVDAFFSQTSPSRPVQAARPRAANAPKPARRGPQTPRKQVLPAQKGEDSLADETAEKRDEKKQTTAATVTPRHRDTATPRQADTMTATTVEAVRKAVKQIGKEAATHRFTVAEKRTLVDLVYTYGRQGYRTTENEITRIALHWLVLNDEENGRESVLAQVLRSLKE